MKKYGLILLILFSFIYVNSSAQTPGRSYYVIKSLKGEISKTINLWGNVQLPGRYEVPVNTNLIQLLTYAGGPRQYSVMDEVKIYRVDSNGRRRVIEVDLENQEDLSAELLKIQNEDTILIEQSSFVSWRDFFSLIAGPLAIVSSILVVIDRLK